MSRQMLQRCAAAAARAAVAAGTPLAKHLGRPRTVDTKRHAVDLVTELDRSAERLILRTLRRAYPQFGFLGEEQGVRQGDAPYRWIVDPLDGTTNFVHGLPIFGVSIGLQHRPPRGRPSMLAGVIYDPMRRELFVATKGGGAFLNGKRIRASRITTLGRSLLATGFSDRFLRHPKPYLGWFQAVQRRSHGVRRIGCTVLCLTSIAAGRLDGFYGRDLWPWDMAAGMLLIREAGGRVTDFEGRTPVLEDGRFVASNGLIHRELLRVLARAGST